MISHPPNDPEPHIELKSTLEPPSSIEEPEVVNVKEIMLKARVPFERKKLNLSIYTFDEISIEQTVEETILDKSPSLNYLSNYIGCVFLQVKNSLPHDKMMLRG